MIPFYKEGDSYSFHDKESLKALSGYGALLYHFLASHKNPEFARFRPMEFWKALFSMPDNILDKSASDRLRKCFLDVEKKTGIIENVKVTRAKVYYEAAIQS